MSVTLNGSTNQGLTTAQLATLTTNIAANAASITYTNPINNQPVTVAINAADPSGDAANAIAAWYNLPCTVDFFANYSKVPVDAIKNAIAHKNYTPTDAVPASGSTTQITNDVLVHLARTTFAGSFQMSINNILVASTLFDATQKSLVSSLSDATNTNMPTGASGANQKGGWGGASGVQTVLCKKATNMEKLFADTVGGTGADNTHAATMVIEGGAGLNGQTVQNARGIS